MTPHQLSAATLNCHAAHYIGPEPRPGQKSRQTLLLGRPTQVVGAENFNLVFHFCHGSLGQRQGGGAFPCGKIFSPFWELAICAGARLGVDRCWGMGAVMPDGSYQADIMEDVAIWTATNFSCCNLDNPRRGKICKENYTSNHVQKHMWARFSWEILILTKKSLDVCPNSLVVPNPLVVNSLCLRKSINPVLFPPESPDYGKHTAGIPILCQSSHQIFLHYKRNTWGEIESKTTSSLTVWL